MDEEKEILLVLKEIRDEMKWQSRILDKVMQNTAKSVKPCGQNKSPETERMLRSALSLLKTTPIGAEVEKVLREGGLIKDGN